MAIHLRIYGRVQGVGYRYAFSAQARALHLSGWVRNRADGSVEAMASGSSEALDRIAVWARRGPAGAAVTDVAVSKVDDATVPQTDFEIHPTA